MPAPPQPKIVAPMQLMCTPPAAHAAGQWAETQMQRRPLGLHGQCTHGSLLHKLQLHDALPVQQMNFPYTPKQVLLQVLVVGTTNSVMHNVAFNSGWMFWTHPSGSHAPVSVCIFCPGCCSALSAVTHPTCTWT
jgi:hypothetical protein